MFAIDLAGKESNFVILKVNAFIPERYIKRPSDRIEMYKRIAAIANSEDADDVKDELLDRYGEYKSAIQYISDGCELIDFAYTDENDDEYWESIITNLESYIFSGGEIF